MSNLVNTLIQERSRLEAELQQDPRHVKIQRINELLAAYGADKSEPGAPVKMPNGQTRSDSANHGRPLSKANRVKQEITSLLSRNHSMHRTEILKHMIERGIMGDEKEPISRLAIYLSGSKDQFVSDGSGNYSLARKNKKLGEVVNSFE